MSSGLINEARRVIINIDQNYRCRSVCLSIAALLASADRVPQVNTVEVGLIGFIWMSQAAARVCSDEIIDGQRA